MEFSDELYYVVMLHDLDTYSPLGLSMTLFVSKDQKLSFKIFA